LAQFENVTDDFTSNPLHLQMICDTEGIESLQQPDVISIYEQFLSKKIKHGLETYRQIQEGVSYDFPTRKKRIYSVLTKCAMALVVDKKREIVQLQEDRNDINLSGVATVLNNTSPLEFVHLTFAEFFTAQKFIQMLFVPEKDMGLDEVQLDMRKLFQIGISQQTMRFVEGFFDKNKDNKFNTGVLGCIAEMKKEVFERICRSGMHNLFSFLLGKVFYGVKVGKWMLDSHKISKNGMSLYFYACCSSPQLATLLYEWCPMLQIDDVEKLFEDLVKHTVPSRHSIEKALSRVEDWKSRWPRANFFDRFLNHKFPTELYEFVLENCTDMDDDGLLKKIYSQKKCCKEYLPIILRLGVDLNCGKNGVRLAHIIFRNMRRRGEFELLNFAIKVAKHFQAIENVDSEESLLMRKNIGAKSPQELLLDSNSSEGRELYLRHVVACACALLDTGECEPTYISTFTDQDEFNLKHISNIPELRSIATTFKLHLMRTHNFQSEALRIFQEEKRWIARDFEYSCGCTLVHDACFHDNLALLETLDQNGFDLNSTNQKKETPLHRAACSWNGSMECTEFLLKRLLGKLYIPLDAKRKEIIARTPDEQRHVEDTLSQRDAEGRTPLLAAAAMSEFLYNAKLLIYNLLGPLVIPWGNEELMVTRTELEQQQVERILNVRDAAGFSPLHCAVEYSHNKEILEVMLKNLLGKYFIDDTNRPMQRTLEKQQQIALLLLPKNHAGVTPLLYGAIYCYIYDKQLLLLRNLLGDYFVEKDGTTERPLDTRTDEENQFVRTLMFSEDDKCRSPYVEIQTRHAEYFKHVKLLYEANASYLLPKKPPKKPTNL
jgi:ankyrin repeat protein